MERPPTDYKATDDCSCYLCTQSRVKEDKRRFSERYEYSTVSDTTMRWNVTADGTPTVTTRNFTIRATS